MGKKVMTKVEKSIHEESEKISEARRAIKAQKNIIDNSDIIPEELDDKDWREKEFSFPNNTVRIGTVFSGIGAIEHAFQRLKLKHKIIFAGDIDANCKKSYFANYEINEEDWFTDVREFDASKYRGKVDFVIGGAPCQAFSMVGKRLGFEDARGTLFYEFARIVKETNPKVFLFENVKGMLNHDGGRTWRVIHDIFEELGYDVHFRVLNSKDYGIPQNRERIFCLGFKTDTIKKKIEKFIMSYNLFRNEYEMSFEDERLTMLYESIKKYKLASSEGVNKFQNRMIRYEQLFKNCVISDDDIITTMDQLVELLRAKKSPTSDDVDVFNEGDE